MHKFTDWRTPAPWQIRDGDPKMENLVAEVRGVRIFGAYSPANAIADARLVSAAPELMEACQCLLYMITDGDYAAKVDNIAYAKRAIAKAEGMSSEE